MKKAGSEGNRVACAIKAGGSKWYVSDVDLEDDDSAVAKCAYSVRKTLGKVVSGFLLISAGVKHLIVVLSVPLALENDMNCLEFFEESMRNVHGVKVVKRDESVKNYYVVSSVVEIDTPFKLKDVVRSSAFEYLRKKGLVEEEESEEEENYEF